MVSTSEALIRNTIMTIETKITSADLEAPILISTNTYPDYFFVPANITVLVDKYEATLQSGGSYDHNDYNCPSNYPVVYDDGSDLILFKLFQAYESDLNDDEFVAQLNESCETSYTAQELNEIRSALFEVIEKANILITDAQEEAEAKLEADDKVYVIHTEREEDEETGEKRICSEPELKIFDDQHEAQDYVDAVNQTIDIARIIPKEVARSDFPENF